MSSDLDNSIQQRLFLVGCPRSGTTLLQSFLAAHSEIYSFPESHFFNWLFFPGSLRTRLGLASNEIESQMLKFLAKIQRPELKKHLPKYGLFAKQYVDSFVQILDQLTLEKSKSIWLEKTPDHVNYISYINKYIDNHKFIHIIRNGEDAIASLYEVTHSQSDFWGGVWDLDKCINKWLTSVEISLQQYTNENHKIVIYEDLIDSPKLILKDVFAFINIKFQDNVIEKRESVFSAITEKHELWKQNVSKTVIKTRSRKFMTVFDDAQRKYVAERISHLNFSNMKDLVRVDQPKI